MKALILTDGKAGHENQSKAFARALGLEPEVVEVHFKLKFHKALSYLFDHLGLVTPTLLRFPGDAASRPPVDAASRPPVDAASRPPVDAASRRVVQKNDHLCSPSTFTSRSSDAARRRVYECVIGTGSGTFYAAKAMARRLGVKCGVVLYPRGYRLSTFDCILAPAFDRPAKAPNVIEIPANLVANDEPFYAKGVEAFKEHYQKQTGREFVASISQLPASGEQSISDRQLGTLNFKLKAKGCQLKAITAVIIGGPNKCSTMTVDWMKRELDLIFEKVKVEGEQRSSDSERVTDSSRLTSDVLSPVSRTSNLEPRTSNLEPRTSNLEPRTSNPEPRTSNLEPRPLFWVTTSRRTPPEVEALVDSYPWDYKLLYSKDHFNPIPAFVQLAGTLYVSAESTGMLSEACTFGKAEVRALDNLNPGPSKFRLFVENLRQGGYVDGTRKIDLKEQFAAAKRLMGL